MVSVSKVAKLRILIIRISAMGDVAMTAPVVGELRKNYPNLEIVILTLPIFQPFYRQVAEVEFFSPDFNHRHKGFGGIIKMSRDMGRFDMVADLHDVIRSKMLRRLQWLKGAKVAYIDKGRKEKKELTDLQHKQLTPLKHTISRYRDVFLALGFDLPQIAPPPKICYRMSSQVAALAGRHDDIWVGVAPFAQHLGKIYPPAKMREVIQTLSQRPNIKLFIFGGGTTEQQYAEEVEREIPHVVSMIGRVKLDQEMELISNLDLMLSMDSSAMHLASLVGVPVVSVWGETHPYAGFYGIGQDLGAAIQLEIPCRPCSIYGNKPCARGDYACMHNIPPQKIVEKVLEQIQLRKG